MTAHREPGRRTRSLAQPGVAGTTVTRRGDMADFRRRIDEPALCRHVRDRDQLGARRDRGEVELPGRIVVDHVAYASAFWTKSGRTAISAADVSPAPIPAIRETAIEPLGSTRLKAVLAPSNASLFRASGRIVLITAILGLRHARGSTAI
jgi:hypothetical protein